uniref:Uncharacterized protein n=1 Tax=Pseudoalteromonas citrea DSM 8771 TaxID=1117314 RepID=U1KLJ8_9GAMM
MPAVTNVTKLQGWIVHAVVVVLWTLNQVQGDESWLSLTLMDSFYMRGIKPRQRGRVRTIRLSDEGQNPEF